MRKLLCCALAALALISLESEGFAQQELPAGKFGVATALRQNTGALGGDYGFGFLFGVQAGYHPSFFGSRYSVGAVWGILWGRFNSDNPELVEEVLSPLEMNFGLRFRMAFDPGEPRFLTAGGGGTLMRTNVPIPPDDERLYFGPYASIGVDQYFSRKYLVSLEARYGMIGLGPNSLTLVLSVHFGT